MRRATGNYRIVKKSHCNDVFCTIQWEYTTIFSNLPRWADVRTYFEADGREHDYVKEYDDINEARAAIRMIKTPVNVEIIEYVD